MVREIIKRYKRWFGNPYIVILLILLVAIDAVRCGGFNDDLSIGAKALIPAFGLSIIFPPTSIWLEKLIGRENK